MSDRTVVVFDFDLTLTRGETASRFYTGLLRRQPWRIAGVMLALPVLVLSGVPPQPQENRGALQDIMYGSLRQLGRLIRHDSFPGRTSVDGPLKELELTLGRPLKKAKAVIQHLEQLLEGAKVLHAAGRWSQPEPRPVLPDEL